MSNIWTPWFNFMQMITTFLRPGEKKGFVSQTRSHKYVDSLLPHSPTHWAQFLASWFFFSFFSCQEKKKKNWQWSTKKQNKNKKKWAKNTIKKNSCVSHCSFSIKKHSTYLLFFWQKFVRQTFLFSFSEHYPLHPQAGTEHTFPILVQMSCSWNLRYSLKKACTFQL